MTTLDFLVKFLPKGQGGGGGTGGSGANIGADFSSITAFTGDFALIALSTVAVLLIGASLLYAFNKKRQVSFASKANASASENSFFSTVKSNPKICAIFAIVAVFCLCAAFIFGGIKNAIAESSHDGFSATDIEHYYDESDNSWAVTLGNLVNENFDASDAKFTSIHIEKNPEADDKNIKWQIGEDIDNPWFNNSVTTSADVYGIDCPFPNNSSDNPLLIYAFGDDLTDELCDSLAGKTLFTITANIEFLGQSRTQAIASLDSACDAAITEINELALLDDDQKNAYIQEINNEHDRGIANINKAQNQEGIDTALNESKQVIQEVVDKAKLQETKKEAKYTLEGSATSAASQIYSLEKLSNERKQFYLNQVGEAFNTGCNNIDNATSSDGVENALNNAKAAIADILSAAKKEAAKDAYAYLTEGTDGNTMHFAYDDQSDKRADKVYRLNRFTTDDELDQGKCDFPGWVNKVGSQATAEQFRYVDFEASFANYHPETLMDWFTLQNDLQLDENSFDNLNVDCCRDMSGLFEESSITSFSFDMFSQKATKLERFANVFANCHSLTNVDINNIELTKLTSKYNINYLFWKCWALVTINCDQDLSKYASTMNNDKISIFEECTNLIGGKGTIFSSDHADAEYARPDGGQYSASPGYFTKKGSEEFNGLTFTAAEADSKISYNNYGNNDPDVQYSLDASTWHVWNADVSLTLQSVGDKVYIKGNNPNGFSTAEEDYSSFTMSGKIAASGDVTSLLGGNCVNSILPKYCFYSLFYGCDSLIESPDLPTLQLDKACYEYMFYGCSSLIKAPDLPATSLGISCYYGMFSCCTSLKDAPDLPATTLSSFCYCAMFYSCQALIQAPVLQADQLSESCYANMFEECISLAKPPVLSSKILSPSCYFNMFKGCSSLRVNESSQGCKFLDYTTGAEDAVTGMFTRTGGAYKEDPRAGITYYYDDTPIGSTLSTSANNEGLGSVYPSSVSGLTGNIMLDPSTGTSGDYYLDVTDNANKTSRITAHPQPEVDFEGWFIDNEKIDGKKIVTGTDSIVAKFKGTSTEYDVLTFTAAKAESTVSYFNQGNNTPNINYSFDCTNWEFWEPDTPINLKNVGDKIYVRGNNPNGFSTSLDNYSHFDMTADISASGDIASLIDENCQTTIVPDDYCYCCLFENCTSLINAPNLSSTSLTPGCYFSMFAGCISLKNSPELNASLLTPYCYYGMFLYCSSLEQAPVLSAPSLEYNSYSRMFEGCSSLKKAPALLATKLADSCYAFMFEGCSSLEEVSDLPSETLFESSYDCMFQNCTSLKEAPSISAINTAPFCCYGMFQNCSSLEQVSSIPATTLSLECYTSMFGSCTSLKQAPDLPATSLAYECYAWMFSDCTSLENTPNLPAENASRYCYWNMFVNCSNLKSVSPIGATKLSEGCFGNMFNNCTSLSQAPNLSVEILAERCYYSMFKGCSSLHVNDTGGSGSVEFLKYTLDASNAVKNMFTDTGGAYTDDPIAGIQYYYEGSEPSTYSISIESSDQSMGIVDPSSVDGLSGSTSLDPSIDATGINYLKITNNDGKEINVKAKPNSSAIFDGWYINDTKIDDKGITITEQTKVVAKFSKVVPPTYIVTASIDDLSHGSVSPTDPITGIVAGTQYSVDGNTITIGSDQSARTIKYSSDATQYVLDKWQYSTDGGKSWNDLPDKKLINTNIWFKAVTKKIAPITYSIEVCSNDKGMGTVDTSMVSNLSGETKLDPSTSLAGEYYLNITDSTGNITSIKAKPKGDTSFDGWYNGDDKIYEDGITVYEDTTIIAKFVTGSVKYYGLTFTSDDASSLFCIENNGGNSPDVKYSFNAIDWDTLKAGINITLSDIGDKVYLKGDNPYGFNHSIDCYSIFRMTGKISASGNIMSLIDNGRCYIDEIPNDDCFSLLFKDCVSLVGAPLLPATKLKYACYRATFENTSIVEAPELPATILAGACYGYMFENCTKLTKVHVLPATSLPKYCYYQMFDHCSLLHINNAGGAEKILNYASKEEGAVQEMFFGSGGSWQSDPEPNIDYFCEGCSVSATIDDKSHGSVVLYPSTIAVNQSTTYTVNENQICINPGTNNQQTITFNTNGPDYELFKWQYKTSNMEEYEDLPSVDKRVITADTEFKAITKSNIPEFYAVYNTIAEGSSIAHTLSFYYDASQANRAGEHKTIYSNLPTNASWADEWGYNNIRIDVKNVVIDESVYNIHDLNSTAFMFSGINRAENISGCEYINTANVTNMSSMFKDYGLSSQTLTSVPNVSNWNTSNTKNMSSMFESYSKGCDKLTLVPDVSNWDTSNVEDMSGMFSYYGYSNKSFINVPDVLNWDTSKVKNMSLMFYSFGSNSELSLQPLDLSNWDISVLTNTKEMFMSYASTNSEYDRPVVYATDWNKWEKTYINAENMFTNSKLKGNTAGNWASANTSVDGCFTEKGANKDFYAVFSAASQGGNSSYTLNFYYDASIESHTEGTIYSNLPIDASNAASWEYNNIRSDVNNLVIDESVFSYKELKSTAYMFSDIVNANNLSGLEYLYVDNVCDMSCMFNKFGSLSKSIVSVPDVKNWNTKNVCNMAGMFQSYGSCSESLHDIPDVSNWDTGKVTNMASMFANYASSTSITIRALNMSGWIICSLVNCDQMFKEYAKSNSDNPIVYATDWSLVKSSGVSATDMFTDSKLKGYTFGGWSSANTLDAGCFTKKDGSDEFYAVFNTASEGEKAANTLSFYYDPNKNNHAAMSSKTVYGNLPTSAHVLTDWPYYKDSYKVENIVIEPSVANYQEFKSTACMFGYNPGIDCGFSNVRNISGCEYLIIKNVKNMSGMFKGFGYKNSSFNSVPNVSAWDTSSVTNMSDIFSNFAYSSICLISIPDVSLWNTQNVTDMSNMFQCYGKNSEYLDAVPDVSGWNSFNVTNMSGMFSDYAFNSSIVLQTLDLSGWEINALTNCSQMFMNYASTNPIDTHPVVYATNWNEKKPLDVSASDMFKGSKLKGDTSGDWTSAHTSTNGCFTKKPDPEEFYAILSPINEEGKTYKLCFYYDNAKESHKISGSSVYDNLPTDASSAEDWPYFAPLFYVDAEKIDVVFDSTIANYHGLKSTSGMFGYDSLSQSPFECANSISGCEYFDTQNVTNMSNMFAGFGRENETFSSVPNVANWDMSNVTNMSCMFHDYAFGVKGFVNVPDVSKWDTSNVKNMSSMFERYAYYSKDSLQALDLSNWKIDSLEKADKMFYEYAKSSVNCPVVYSTNWSNKSGVSATDMFTGSKLKGNTTGNWSSANTSEKGCFTSKETYL